MNVQTTTPAEVKPVLTLEEKLVQAKARVAKLEQELFTRSQLNNVFEGDAVVIKFGRGEKVRHVTGKVVGIKDDETGKIVAVLGEDFGTYKVSVRDILSNATAAERDEANAPVAGSISQTFSAAQVADADPLEAA